MHNGLFQLRRFVHWPGRKRTLQAALGRSGVTEGLFEPYAVIACRILESRHLMLSSWVPGTISVL